MIFLFIVAAPSVERNKQGHGLFGINRGEEIGGLVRAINGTFDLYLADLPVD